MLGFSNLVFSNDLEPINTYYETILTDFKEAAKKRKLEFLLISDSIVVYTDSSKNNFKALVKVINHLQHRLFLKGILLRGGISFGKLYVDNANNIVVGAGLVNAYRLELIASYPRIIIDRKLILTFYDGINGLCDDMKAWIRITPPSPYLEDFPYVDYTKGISLDFQPSKFLAVNEVLKRNLYDNVHFQKYEWVRKSIQVAINEQLEYIESMVTQTKQSRKRLKLINDFLSEFNKL